MIDTVRRHLPVKYRELAKFLVVGGTSYVVDVGLFTLMSHTVLTNKVVTAKAISVIIATILSYILNREWSFSRRGGREPRHEAMLFFLVNGVALAVNLIPLALSQYVLGFNTDNFGALTVSIANFISANIIGTSAETLETFPQNLILSIWWSLALALIATAGRPTPVLSWSRVLMITVIVPA